MSKEFLETQNEKLIGNNVIFCKNKLIAGQNHYAMYFSSLLVLTPNILLVFLILNSVNAFSNETKGFLTFLIISLTIIVISFVFLSGCKDPGILKRKIDRSITKKFDNFEKVDYRILTRGSILKYTICYSCNLVRPSRTSHCAECDNCTERFDHHCIWIGNCVGKRNHKNFILFLIVLNVAIFINLVIAIITLVAEINKYNNLLDQKGYASFEESKAKLTANIGIASTVIIFNSIFEIFFVGKLLLDHLIYSSKNITFYENLKKKFNTPFGNPYYKGSILKNFYFLLCKKVPLQSLNFANIYNTNISESEFNQTDNFKDDILSNDKVVDINMANIKVAKFSTKNSLNKQ